MDEDNSSCSPNLMMRSDSPDVEYDQPSSLSVDSPSPRVHTPEVSKKSKKQGRQVNEKKKKSVPICERYLSMAKEPPSDLEDSDLGSEFSDNDDELGESNFELDEGSSESEFSVVDEAENKTIPRLTSGSPVPFWLDEVQCLPLSLPNSSEDLLISKNYVLDAFGIYEVLRHFRTLIRISPFIFEDFCAALASDEQNALMNEVHIQLIKGIIREDEKQSTMFTAPEQKDSVNVLFFSIDDLTWPEVLRTYLQSDISLQSTLKVIENINYPYTSIENRLKVLQFLTDGFLSTSPARDYIIKEGNLQYDDHCRVCHKLGDLLCCESCSATYHLDCVYPPLEDLPEGEWKCSICAAHQIEGVSNCESDLEKIDGRKEPLGYDRKGNKYWFIGRRVVIELVDGGCMYYSLPVQLENLCKALDPDYYEKSLLKSIGILKDEIIRAMQITEDLTEKSKGTRKSYFEIENEVLLDIENKSADLNDDSKTVIKEEFRGISVITEELCTVNGETKTKDEPCVKFDNDNDSKDLKPGESLLQKKLVDLTAGEIMTRKKAQQIASGTYIYKLGMDNNHQKYVNQYSTNPLALNKPQHQEEKDRRRQLSHKFTFTQLSEFKWSGNVHGTKEQTLSCLRQTLLLFESNIPLCLMHVNWSLLRKPWQTCVTSAGHVKDFIRIVLVFVACIRPVVFNTVWHESLGHTSAKRTTAIEREERKKQEKRDQKDKEMEEERNRLFYNVKYTLGIKQTLLKLKGEEYRIHGQWGWEWLSSARTYRCQNFMKLGLRNGAAKMFMVDKSTVPQQYVLVDTKIYREINKIQMAKLKYLGGDGDNLGVEPFYSNGGDIMDEGGDTSSKKINGHNYKNLSEKYFSAVPDPGELELVDVSRALSSKIRILYPKVASKGKLDDLLDRRLQYDVSLSNKSDLPKSGTEFPDQSASTVKSQKLLPPAQTDDLGQILENQPDESKNEVKIITSDSFVAELFLTAQQDHLKVANKIITLNRTVTQLENVCRFQCYSCQNDNKNLCYSPSCREHLFLVQRQKEVKEFVYQLKKSLDIPSKSSSGEDLEQTLPGTKSEDEPGKEASCKSLSNGPTVTKPFSTRDPFSLKKLKSSQGISGKKKVVKYPQNSIFRTKVGKKSNILILSPHDLKHLAKKGGKVPVPGFHQTMKSNFHVWPYPCSRPLFKTCWLYRTTQATSVSAICLLVKVLWACLRWDDIQARPPTSETKRQITTETEIITTEILDRKTEGRFSELTKYLVRKIRIPLEVPKHIRSVTPTQRSGLRKRRLPEVSVNPEPQVGEEWVDEMQLELWEIKQYAEKNNKSFPALTRFRSGVLSQDKQLDSKSDKLSLSGLDNKDKLEHSGRSQRGGLSQRKIIESNLSENLKTTITTEVTADGKTFRKYTLTPSFRSEPIKPVTPVQTFQPHSGFQLLTLSDGRKVIFPRTLNVNQPAEAKPQPEQIIVPSVAKLLPNKKITIDHLRFPSDRSETIGPITISKTSDGKIIIKGLQPGQQVSQLPDGRLQITSVPKFQPVIQNVRSEQPLPKATAAASSQLVIAKAPDVSKTFSLKLPPKEPGGPEPVVHVVHSAAGTKVICQGGETLSPEQMQVLQTSVKLCLQKKSNKDAATQLEEKKSISKRVGGKENQQKLLEQNDDSGGRFVVTQDYVSQTIKQALKSGNLAPEVEQKLLNIQKLQATQNSVCKPVLASRKRPQSDDEWQPLRKLQKKDPRFKSGDAKIAENRLKVTLLKHKEQLKRDIIKKRFAMEREIESEIKKALPKCTTPKSVSQGVITDDSSLAQIKKTDMKSPIKSPKKPLRKKKRFHRSPSESEEEEEEESEDDEDDEEGTQIKSPKGSRRQLNSMVGKPDEAEEKTGASHKRLKMNHQDQGKKRKSKLYCICQTPFDETKFYVGCDLCNNWFHGSCVGITERMSKKMSEYICKDCKESKEGKELYCLCKTPYDETMFYICCDKCQDWFHGRCVGILQSEADSIEEYICPNCNPKAVLNRANKKILDSRDWINLKKTFEQIKVHKNAWPFIKPVDPKCEPRYYQVIKEPMDLETVEGRISRKKYKTLSDFVSDMTKIFDNCRYYNSTNSKFSKCADGLESFFLVKVKHLRQKLMHS